MTTEPIELRRDPPERVKQILRTEVGFGCPVKGCREPFLSWHHFDPPWSVKHHHDSEGMIALCVKHHKMADLGVYSTADLRLLKNSECAVDSVRAKFEWARPGHLIRMGGFYTDAETTQMPRLIGFPEDLIRIEASAENLQELSFRLHDRSDTALANMKKNAFEAYPPRLFDLRVDTGGTKIRIKHCKNDLVLDLWSRRITLAELDRMLVEDRDWWISWRSLQERTRPDFRSYPMNSKLVFHKKTTGINLDQGPISRGGPGIDLTVESREAYKIEGIRANAINKFMDDDGKIMILDFRNFVSYMNGRKLEIKRGVNTTGFGQGFGQGFGAVFSRVED